MKSSLAESTTLGSKTILATRGAPILLNSICGASLASNPTCGVSARASICGSAKLAASTIGLLITVGGKTFSAILGARPLRLTSMGDASMTSNSTCGGVSAPLLLASTCGALMTLSSTCCASMTSNFTCGAPPGTSLCRGAMLATSPLGLSFTL